jgi:hypothetical protein
LRNDAAVSRLRPRDSAKHSFAAPASGTDRRGRLRRDAEPLRNLATIGLPATPHPGPRNRAFIAADHWTGCEAPDVVRLEAVVLLDRSLVAVIPPANLRCTMAEAIAGWVREEAAPRALDLGSSLTVVENLTSFDCRGRNGIAGAKLSEHGKANALDIHSLRLANGKVVVLTDPHVPKDFREGLRKSVCAQFTTVLGPGSDDSHEDHIHVDLLQRRGGYRICEWDIREPGEAPPASALVASVPLPRARPAIDARPR